MVKLDKRFVFFDLDGTLIDSAHAIALAWEKWAECYGISQPSLERALGGTSIDTVRKLVSPDKVQSSWDALTQYELQTAHLVHEVRGASQLLANLPPRNWGLVTSSRRAVALARMRSAGIVTPSYFVTADDYNAGKPSPEPYLVGLRRIEMDAEQCLTFEDSPPGIESARMAGVDVVGVATYCRPVELAARWSVLDWTHVHVSILVEGRLSIILDED